MKDVGKMTRVEIESAIKARGFEIARSIEGLAYVPDPRALEEVEGTNRQMREEIAELRAELRRRDRRMREGLARRVRIEAEMQAWEARQGERRRAMLALLSMWGPTRVIELLDRRLACRR